MLNDKGFLVMGIIIMGIFTAIAALQADIAIEENEKISQAYVKCKAELKQNNIEMEIIRTIYADIEN